MFNHPSYLQEFRNLVLSLGNISTALEVGAYSGELMDVLKDIGIKVSGISLKTTRSDVVIGDFLKQTYTGKFDLVYSSGVLEHYEIEDIRRFIRKMKSLSNYWVLNIVPNSRCNSYMQAKRNTNQEWGNEKDFTVDELLKLHLEFGEGEFIAGEIGYGWAKIFNPTEDVPYLVYTAIHYLNDNHSPIDPGRKICYDKITNLKGGDVYGI